MLREAMNPLNGGGAAPASQPAQIVNHTEVTVNANVSSDYDLDKLTREIVRRINA